MSDILFNAAKNLVEVFEKSAIKFNNGAINFSTISGHKMMKKLEQLKVVIAEVEGKSVGMVVNGLEKTVQFFQNDVVRMVELGVNAKVVGMTQYRDEPVLYQLEIIDTGFVDHDPCGPYVSLGAEDLKLVKRYEGV